MTTLMFEVRCLPDGTAICQDSENPETVLMFGTDHPVELANGQKLWVGLSPEPLDADHDAHDIAAYEARLVEAVRFLLGPEDSPHVTDSEILSVLTLFNGMPDSSGFSMFVSRIRGRRQTLPLIPPPPPRD